MRISDTELRKLIDAGPVGHETDAEIEARIRREDSVLIQHLAAKIDRMSDRDDVIADLKARIEAGTYNPTGDEIAEAMIRRNVADRAR